MSQPSDEARPGIARQSSPWWPAGSPAITNVRQVADDRCEIDPVTSASCVIIGAGPAGLTAAHALNRHGLLPTVLEASDVVGGIAQTVERDGWRFDIGGHRFFTKVPEIERLWHVMLPSEHWLTRARQSRIHFDGKLFDYPLNAGNVLRNLGPLEAVRCLLSYCWVRIRPPRDQSHFEGWVAARFGWRLYRMFFETYTQKVWGTHPSLIEADWAAQRIKGLSLLGAVVDSLTPRRRRRPSITSLITEFRYPRYGPGMLWQECRRSVEHAGTTVATGMHVTQIVRRPGVGATAVRATATDGSIHEFRTDHVISSMPLGELIESMDPPAPPPVRLAARQLRHRDFLTVALIVPESSGFPDNWIYIHSPDVSVGRIQNFGAWSPHMVVPGTTCLGLEYFVDVGDSLWSAPDHELVVRAMRELAQLGLVEAELVQAGYVVRMPKAYPVYDDGFQARVDTIRCWLEAEVPNAHPVGRNGMHRYNNQDHSMMTALLTVENIVTGASNDVWAINVEEDYIEGRAGPAGHRSSDGRAGTGRAAPMVPRRPDGDAAFAAANGSS
jgi:protoporphyrinogen oxidase